MIVKPRTIAAAIDNTLTRQTIEVGGVDVAGCQAAAVADVEEMFDLVIGRECARVVWVVWALASVASPRLADGN